MDFIKEKHKTIITVNSIIFIISGVLVSLGALVLLGLGGLAGTVGNADTMGNAGTIVAAGAVIIAIPLVLLAVLYLYTGIQSLKRKLSANKMFVLGVVLLVIQALSMIGGFNFVALFYFVNIVTYTYISYLYKTNQLPFNEEVTNL